MMASFILGAPVMVSVVTVYLAERAARRTWGYYFVAPFVANLLFVVGTLLVEVEGWICAIVIVPLFAVVGGLVGLAMGAICRFTNWPRRAIVEQRRAAAFARRRARTAPRHHEPANAFSSARCSSRPRPRTSGAC